jgi:phosphoglycolate phosphatase-like HAD superfamily hydrolase
MRAQAPLLLLFDIDGTLLAGATAAHREALDIALLEVHGVDVHESHRSFAPAGRTDGEIARALLLMSGVSEEQIDERADAVKRRSFEAYARVCPPDLSEFVLPGVPELLEWSAERGDATLALLTGNFERIGRLKLARAGIGDAFAAGQGAFGSDAEDRSELPAIARRRAGADGVWHPRERTIVIGDTPRDIACARADGVRCVAVATGPYEVAKLAGADHAVEDADGVRAALEAELA